MRYSTLLLLLALNASLAFGQNDTIFTRDTIELNYQIKNTIIPNYKNLLLMIAYPDMNQNEIDKMIENNVNGSKETKLFYNDKVIIENDLAPGAAKDKLLRGDLEVTQYLRNFYTGYTKTDVPNINFTVGRISSLKKKDYYYYNVQFESDFGGTTTSGKKYDKFNRVAEMVVVKDGKWHLYIGAIRFPADKEKDFDTTNVYRGIVESNGDLERILKAVNDEKQAKKREEEKKIKGFLFDGDNAFEEKKFDVALSKYHEAFMINPSDRETIESVNKTRKAIAEKKRLELLEIERQKHIALMKINARKEKDNYNFKAAKTLCDSLIKDFGVTDADIVKLTEKMVSINSSLSGIEIALASKNYSEALDKCDAEIKKAKTKKDSISISEFNYQGAMVSIANDDKESHIFDYLNYAILFSNEHHQAALKARASMFVKTTKISDAIQDATHIIENDSRNPANFVFRASIFDNNNFPDRAIEDYGSAISFHTDDMKAYINKARLEYSKAKYFDVVKTATDGIVNFKFPAGLLYYYRGFANREISNFALAGSDFRMAKKIGIPPAEKARIRTVSDEYVTKGITNYQFLHYPAAVTEFTKAILVDSSEQGLYNRGLNYIRLNVNDSAIIDCNALIVINPKFPNVYANKGIALTNKEKYADALTCFGQELATNKVNPYALYYKGQCELKQKDYANAAKSFDAAATIIPTDSSDYYSALANYNLKNYEVAIAKTQLARKLDTKRFSVYYICGKAYYDQKKYSNAVREYETAKTMVAKNDDLNFAYAQALEMTESYEKAATAYNQLAGTLEYNDTASLRSGICIIKKHDVTKYPEAIRSLVAYLAHPNTDTSEGASYLGYAYLSSGDNVKAAESIAIAQVADENNGMLHYVLACQCANGNNEAEALVQLEKAMASKRFTADDVKSEKFFKNLKKNDKFKALLGK